MGKKIIIWRIVAVVALGVGSFGIKSWRHRCELRSKIYKPLYQEVTAVGDAVQTSSYFRAVPSTTFLAVQKDPLWKEVSADLHQEVQETYEKAWERQRGIVVVLAHTNGLSPNAVRAIRKEADDQAWIKKVIQSAPPPRAKWQHARHEAVMDRSDPAHPRILLPGGPIWRLQDWLVFPQNIRDVDQEWSENDFLFLSDTLFDNWRYRGHSPRFCGGPGKLLRRF